MPAEPFTLRSAAGLPDALPDLERAPLVVIDAQMEYSSEGGLPLTGIDTAVDCIAELLTAWRDRGRPVVHVAHVGGALFNPDAGGRFLPRALPEPGEAIVRKRLPNAFAGTELSSVIERLGGGPVVLCGFMTHLCVSSTARAALDLGVETVVVADATATRDLPAATGSGVVPAAEIAEGTLAALADRFSLVSRTENVVGLDRPGSR